jgi:tetratricopeptide (TPR) repeat protein
LSVLDLSQILVAEEIARIRAEGWSGVLALTQGEVTKGLFFVEGAIAFAASTVEEDRLGACLFRAGRITESQFRAAMHESEALRCPLGRALVELGHLTPDELAAAVTAQVERIVLSVLRWTTGLLRRDPMDRPLPADLALDLDTPRLLLLGMRQFPDAERLERGLGAPERQLRRVTPPPFDYEKVAASPEERAVLALCRRPAALGDLMALPHPRPRLVRATSALLAGGLVEDAPRSAAPVPGPPRDAARPVVAPPRAAPAEPDRTPPPPPPRTADDSEREARALLEKGQRQRAIEVLRESLDRFPEARRPRRLLAMTLGREGGFDPEVERLFLGLLEGTPQDAELRYALASYYRRAGLAGRAILQLRLVLSADPGHAAAWRDLGELEAGETRRGR